MRTRLHTSRCCAHIESPPAGYRQHLRDREDLFGNTRNGFTVEGDTWIREPARRNDVRACDIDGRAGRLNAGALGPKLRENLRLRE
jgi:hypothetical protein